MAIGIGNVWRFPFIAYANGGGSFGTFVVPYLIVLVVIAQPVYYLEMLLGQFSSRGCLKVFEMVPAMKGRYFFLRIVYAHTFTIGVGYTQIYAIGMAATYLACLLALTNRFFVASFQATLPWRITMH